MTGNKPPGFGIIHPNPTAHPPMPTLLNEPPLRPTHEVFRVERILDPDEPHAKRNHRVIAVLPAYNAERTLAATLADFPPGCVDEIFSFLRRGYLRVQPMGSTLRAPQTRPPSAARKQRGDAHARPAARTRRY